MFLFELHHDGMVFCEDGNWYDDRYPESPPAQLDSIDADEIIREYRYDLPGIERRCING